MNQDEFFKKAVTKAPPKIINSMLADIEIRSLITVLQKKGVFTEKEFTEEIEIRLGLAFAELSRLPGKISDFQG